MSEIFWNVTTSGDWNVAANWTPETVPGAGDDAVLGVTGFAIVQSYTVSVTAAIDVSSITISDADAELSIANAVTASVADDVTNAGDIELQYGGQFSIGGSLSNLSTSEGTAVIDVDTQTNYGLNPSGGSSLTVTGALDNTGRFNIGNSGLTAPTVVTVGSLQNTGVINLTGNASVGDSKQATLDVLSAAPSVWTGTITIAGQALFEFSGGSIGGIAQGAEIYLGSSDGYIADAGSTSSDSALSGLTSNAGDFELQDGASLSLSGGLTNTGTLNVDTNTDYGLDPNGGSTLVIEGTLTNDDTLAIGNSILGAEALVKAASLVNTGSISIVGDIAKGNEAVLDIAGAAPTTLMGSYDLGGRDTHGGDSLLEFGSGKITSIAAGAELYLANPTSFVADADDLTHDSALTSLSSNAGDFELQDAAAPLTLAGGLTNTGTIHIDTNTDYGLDPNGGSRLTIDGTLTNTGEAGTNDGTLDIGNSILGAESLVTAASLANTGSIAIVGDNAKGNEAILDITGAAPTTLTGFYDLGGRDTHGGDSLLEFGSGQITSIAAGAELYLANPTSFVADADDTTQNSALKGLTSNAGDLELQDAEAPLTLSGGLTNTGTINVDTNTDYGGDPNGGSQLTIGGTLTNDDALNIGNGILGAESLVTAASLANTGAISITGGSSNEAILDIKSAALATWTGSITLAGEGSLEFASGSIATIAQGASLSVSTGDGYVEDATATGANSALTGLTANAGGLYFDFGASVSIGGNFGNTGTLGVDEHVIDGFDNSGGSTLHIAGTLTNSATVDIGNYALSGPTLVTAGGLSNTAAGTINMTAANGYAATFDVTAAAPSVWTGTLNISGEASLVYGSGSIGSIAQGAEIALYASNGYIADAGATSSNSALSGLTSNAGGLYFDFGASVSIGGNFSNTGTLGVDEHEIDGFDNSGGSTLHVAGTLTNSSNFYIGNLALSGPSAVTAGGLDNTSTGTIVITGVGSNAASLTVTAAAPTVWTGTLDLDTGNVLNEPNGGASLVFASGSIGSIAAGATIAAYAADAYVADSATPASNSALSGLTSNAGGLYFDFGASAAIGGNLSNTGTIGVDQQVFDGFDNSGGSTLTIAGTLTNSATVDIGNYVLSGTVTFSAGALTNQSGANVNINGSGSAQASVTVTGALDNAGSWTANTAANEVVGSLVNTGTLTLNGSSGLANSLQVLGTASNANAMTVGVYANVGAVGAFTDSGVLNIGGALDVDDGLTITSTGGLVMQGGEVLTPGAATVTVDSGGTVSGDGTILPGIANGGTITASNGLLTLSGPINGAGSLAITTGAELELGGATAETVGFGGDVGTLKLDEPGSFTGPIIGLVQGDTIDLAGVQATSAVVNGTTLTVTAGAETFTYQVAGSGLAGNVFELEDDGQGGTNVVLGPPGPVISGPTSQTGYIGIASVLGPISVEDPSAGSGVLTAVITSEVGLMAAAAAGNGTVSGNFTRSLTLTGDLNDLNAELASLLYATGASGSDTVNIRITDANNEVVSHTIALNIGSVPFTSPVINLPSQDDVINGMPTDLNGVSISDPYAEATGQPLEFGLNTGPLQFANVTENSSATVTGQNTGALTISGAIGQINADLADGSSVNNNQEIAILLIAAVITFFMVYSNPQGKSQVNKALGIIPAAINNAFQTVIGKAVSVANNSKGAQGLRDAVKGLNGLASYVSKLGQSGNQAHILTFDNLLYELNAVGEFILAKSTQVNNSFQVQVRLQGLQGSASASEITEVAAAVGSDRVTFGVGRADTVGIDGVGTPMSVGETLTLPAGGGQIKQVSVDTYLLVWNTGEIISVTDNGTYLDVSVQLAEGDGPGTVEGLMGPATGQANDFELPDGTILQQPLSTSELYGTFANAWRVTQATSLLDYGAGQSTTTFTDTSFPTSFLTLSDFPSAVVQQAQQAVAAAGITDPGVAAAAEFDYIVSGGDMNVVRDDASQYQGLTTTPATVTASSPPPAALGVIPGQQSVAEAASGATAVTFDVYLTAASTSNTTVDYAIVSPDADDFTSAAFGGSLPSGSVVILAGQTSGEFTVDVPENALGNNATEYLAAEISSPGGPPIVTSTAQEAVYQAEPGPPAAPKLEYLSTIGTFTQSGDDYTLDLGDLQLGELLPNLQFGIVNAASAPADELSGSISWSSVGGYTVDVDGTTTSSVDLPSPISAGADYEGLFVAVNTGLFAEQTIKFGSGSETITFDPVDTNVSGYTKPLSPITLTIDDTLEVPGMIYSQAWGDVHIITYNGLHYNFQAAGEFTLAKSNVADDSFDIQLRLQPYMESSSVTLIEQVAASLGSDRVTFGVTGLDRAATVLVDGNVTTLSMADPTLTLAGGSITEVSPSLWKVAWNTGESMTVTESSAFEDTPYFNVSDAVPYASYGEISGLQGENEGVDNDFQLPDGTVLPQPLTTSELYGEYADAWRVTQATSLFDYGPGQSTATFTNYNFPDDAITLADLPASVVANAAALVAAAGITDPVTAENAELDYIATGDPSFIASAANINQQVTNTVAPTINPSTPPATAIGVEAGATKVTEAASGVTAVTFTAYLTAAESTATTVDYAVIAPYASDLPASAFGGTLPSASVTIAANATTAQFTIDVPQGALGALPNETLDVQVSSPGDAIPIFAPTAETEIVNNQAEAGNPAVPELAYLGNTGAFSFDAATNTYTLNLGGLTQGASVDAAEFAVVNAATGSSDNLAGTFTAPTGAGFIVTGDNLPSPLAAGEVYQGLYTSINTADLGSNEMSLTFDPEDVNDSGYSKALTPLTLKIVDSVVAAAQPKINTPTTIIFPNAHVGATDSQHVSVTNTAGAGAADLDVTLSASGEATASGKVTDLAPGATDASDLSVGINTSAAGALSGSVTESFVSDGGGGNTSPIAEETPYIDVFGSAYRLADPSIIPGDLTVHVGDSGTQLLTITNVDPSDGYSENLIATVVGTTGALTASGTTGDIKPQGDGSIAVHFSTATPGPVGTVTLDLKSDGTGIDGLGVTDLGDVTIPVAVTSSNVLAAAQFEEISGGGTFAHNGSAYSLNLGTITAPATVSLGVLNSAEAPADALSGSFQVSGASEFVNSGFAAFSGVAAGQADAASSVTLDTGVAGTFDETITLDPVDAATSAALPVETLTITGTIATPTPPPILTAPASVDVAPGVASAVAGVSVADSNSGASVTVTLLDARGLLSANTSGAGGGGAITGAGSTNLTIAGTVVEVNADLATLTDADSQPGDDAIVISADDSFGGTATPATIVVTPASGTITINPVDGDNVINDAEANASGGVALSGTVSGLAAEANFSVSVTDGSFSASYTATVNSAATGWTATIPEAAAVTLPNGSATVTAEVNSSLQASETVTVAKTLPTVTIAAVEGNNVIDNAEANASSGVALSGAVTGLAANSTFSVSVVDGAFSKSYTATVNSAGTGWTATIPEAAAITLPNGAATISAEVTDAYGNVSTTATDKVTVAETLPTVTIAAVDGNNVIDNAEAHASSGVALSGAVTGLAANSTFSVSVVDGAFSKSYTATVNSAGTGWTATIPEAAAITLPNGAATISAEVTDAYGNVSTKATDNVRVAETLPTVTIAAVDGDNVIDNAEAHASSGVALSGAVTGLAANSNFLVSFVDGSFSASYTATVNSAATGWTATIPEAAAITLPNGTATLTATISGGNNVVLAHATDKVTVAETLPTVTINKINGDDVVNNRGDNPTDWQWVNGCGWHWRSGCGRSPAALSLSGAVTGIAADTTFQIQVADGSFENSYTATVNAAGTGWTATMPAANVSELPNGVAVFSATVVDAYGNASLPAVQDVTVEGTTPTVLSVTASPSSGDFGVGKTIEITLHMNEAVTVRGAPTLALNDCGTATYDKSLSTASSLVFDYTVGAGQNTSDLKVTSVDLSCGASIADSHGDAANLSGADQALGLMIDTTPPEVTCVSTSPSHGEVKTGQHVTLTLAMSEAVTVSGSPSLLLNDGGAATFDAAHSTSTSLAFDYTPASGQFASALEIVGVAYGATSSIADSAGNAALLSGAARPLQLSVNTMSPHAGASGPGTDVIAAGGDTELFCGSSETVQFASQTSGLLTLDSAENYGGDIVGLGGGNGIDLADMAFTGHTLWQYQAGRHGGGGVLTVSDGWWDVARLTLTGDYAANSFKAVSDGHGGTLIHAIPVV